MSGPKVIMRRGGRRKMKTYTSFDDLEDSVTTLDQQGRLASPTNGVIGAWESDGVDLFQLGGALLSQVTDSRLGTVDAGSTGVVFSVTAGHEVLATDTVMVWDKSAATELATSRAVVSVTATSITVDGADITVAIGDVLYALGVSEFSIGSAGQIRPGANAVVSFSSGLSINGAFVLVIGDTTVAGTTSGTQLFLLLEGGLISTTALSTRVYNDHDVLVSQITSTAVLELRNITTQEVIAAYQHNGTVWAIGETDLTVVSSSPANEIPIGAGSFVQVDAGTGAFLYGTGLQVNGTLTYSPPGHPVTTAASNGAEDFICLDEFTGLFCAAELLTDGDMEAAGTAQWATTNVAVAKDNTVARTGTQSLKITGGGVAGTGQTQNAAAIPAAPVMVTGWLLGDGGSNTHVGLVDSSQTSSVIFDTAHWHPFCVIVVSIIRIYPDRTAPFTAIAWLDDISARRVLV